jgi:Cu/Ag efflux protein CusF
MKKLILAIALAFLAGGVPAFAADEHGGHGDGKHEAGPVHAGSGKVVAVDANAGTVKIAHEPIESLKWRKMTMDFTVHDKALLQGIEPGMQVKFELMKMGGSYHVMKIGPVN